MITIWDFTNLYRREAGFPPIPITGYLARVEVKHMAQDIRKESEVKKTTTCDRCGIDAARVTRFVTKNGYGDAIGAINVCDACIQKEQEARKKWCPILCVIAVLCLTLPFLLYLR